MFISFCASSIFMFFLYALDYEEFYLQKEFPCEWGKLWKGKEFVNLCPFFLSLVTSSLTGSKALYCFPEFHYKASAETECFGLGLGSSPFSIFFSQLKFFSFHDVGVLFQPLFLNYFKHIFEYFRLTALIKNWIYKIQLTWMCSDNFPFLLKTSQIFYEKVQVLVAVSLTCPHPPVDGHLSLHPGPPHNKCRGYQGLRPDLSLPLFLLHSGQVGANLGKILCDLGPLPHQTV